MAKKQNFLKLALLSGALLIPVAGAYASSVQVTVNIAAVASIANVETEVDEYGITTYTATVATNSIHGYKLYASSNGEDWTLIKTFEGYPTGEDLKGTAKTTGGDVKFKVEAIQ
jgi:hypothetical protein